MVAVGSNHAHLRRRDDWTNLAQKLIEAILPIQPALHWIGRRMSIEREMACDDWVIATTGTAKPYAASLTKVAELSQWEHAGILAAGAAGNRSQLFCRVHHMLNRTRNAAPKLALGPLGAGIAAAGILVYVAARAPEMIAFAQTPASENIRQELPQTPFTPQAPLAPMTVPAPAPPLALPPPLTPVAALPPAALAPPSPAQAVASPLAPPAPPAPGAPMAPMSPPAPLAPVAAQRGGETHMDMTTRTDGKSFSVKLDGAIEFTDDDHDVKSLSPGGHFRMEEGSWLSGRAYDVRADSEGNLTKTYSVDRSTKPLDSDGRAWLESLLPQVIRETAIGAESCVARILRQSICNRTKNDRTPTYC